MKRRSGARGERDKKPVLSACAVPPCPPPEDGVMGQRWKRDFEEGVILPWLPWRRRRGIRAEAPDTARDVKIRTHTVLFTLCTWLLLEVLWKVTLQSILFGFEHIFLKLTMWADFFHFVSTDSTKLVIKVMYPVTPGCQLKIRTFAKAAEFSEFENMWFKSTGFIVTSPLVRRRYRFSADTTSPLCLRCGYWFTQHPLWLSSQRWGEIGGWQKRGLHKE